MSLMSGHSLLLVAQEMASDCDNINRANLWLDPHNRPAVPVSTYRSLDISAP